MRDTASSDVQMFKNYTTVGAPIDEVRVQFTNRYAYEMQFHDIEGTRTQIHYMTPGEPHCRALQEFHRCTGWYIYTEYELTDRKGKTAFICDDGDFYILDGHPDDEGHPDHKSDPLD